jgi:transposase-like zinc-binding protein/putative transposase
MRHEWGRAPEAGKWQRAVPVWFMAVLVIAVASGIAVWLARQTFVCTPLQQFYLLAYAQSAVASSLGIRTGRVSRAPDGEPQRRPAFLRCGCLAGGFARFRCTECGLDRLVAFSCQGRGFCPRCGGRRMAERSAHLVDHVFPDVPVRQWVLSLPHRLRYLLAWDHELCRAVTGVALQTVLGFLRRRARRDGVPDGRSGAVAIVQHFGGALNLNVHLHALVLDGVFVLDEGVQFHPVRRLTREDMAAVVALIARRVERQLERRGLAGGAESGPPDLWSEEAPVLAAAAAASVESRVALGPPAGARVRRCGDPPGWRQQLWGGVTRTSTGSISTRGW